MTNQNTLECNIKKLSHSDANTTEIAFFMPLLLLLNPHYDPSITYLVLFQPRLRKNIVFMEKR